MLSLILAVNFQVLFVLMMKWGKAHRVDMDGANLINYAVGAIVALATLFGGIPALTSSDWGVIGVLGTVNGIVFVSTLLILQWSIPKNGAALTATFFRLGVLVPVVLSVVLFSEIPTLLQGLGVLAAVAAILLFGGGSGGASMDFRVLLVVFLGGGAVDLMAKLFTRFGPEVGNSLYLAVTFVVGTILSLGLFLRAKGRLDGRALAVGAVMGVANLLCTLMILRAAAVLPSYVIFPGYSVLVILEVSLVELFTGELKLTPRRLLGWAAIALAIVLLGQS